MELKSYDRHRNHQWSRRTLCRNMNSPQPQLTKLLTSLSAELQAELQEVKDHFSSSNRLEDGSQTTPTQPSKTEKLRQPRRHMELQVLRQAVRKPSMERTCSTSKMAPGNSPQHANLLGDTRGCQWNSRQRASTEVKALNSDQTDHERR